MAGRRKRIASKAAEDRGHLVDFRDAAQDITRSILSLARSRQSVSLKIADVKEAAGLDIEDHAVEEKLSSAMVDYAGKIGLDEKFAESIVSLLIEYSKIAQRKKIYEKSIKKHLRSSRIKKISIIGAGRMGVWFARYFRELGAKVILYDLDRKLALVRARQVGCYYAATFDKAASSSDMVLIAVPLVSAPSQIRKLFSSRTRESHNALRVIEISSVKNEMARANLVGESARLQKNVDLYSVHPLFGPSSNAYSVNTMIEIKRNQETGLSSGFIKNLFPHFRLLNLDWETHDKLMSVMLTIPHAHALAFADTFSKHVKSMPKRLNSPSFDYMLELARRVLKENPDVYYEIEANNPNADAAIGEVLASTKRLRKLIRSRQAFRNYFREIEHAIN